MSIKVRRLSFALGAEITGVDLRMPLDDATKLEIKQAWLEHLVVVFPEQDISPEQQIAFGRMFGPLDDHKALPYYQHPEYPEMFLITNKEVNGKPSESRQVGRRWHSDHSFTTHPTMASILHCRVIPEVGGTTMFANMYMAYDALSDTLKRMVEGLEAVHDIAYYYSRYMEGRVAEHIERVIKINPPVAQPVVRTHPETGRKALYVSEDLTSQIVGMTRLESAGLLDSLFEISVRPEFLYRHAWKVGDLLMWDNRCTMHRAPADYDPKQIRLMHRVTVLGTPCGRVVDRLAQAA